MNLTKDVQLYESIPTLLEFSHIANSILEDQHDVSGVVNRFLRELSMPEGGVLDDNLMEGVKWLESMYSCGVNGILIGDDLG